MCDVGYLYREITQFTGVFFQVVAVHVTDASGPAYFVAHFSNGLVTDSSWKCHYEAEAGWETPTFDDSHWSPAQTGGQYPLGHGRAAQKIWWWGDEMTETVENPNQCHANQMYCRYKGPYAFLITACSKYAL